MCCPGRRLLASVELVNERVHRQARQMQTLHGMGTTLVAFHVDTERELSRNAENAEERGAWTAWVANVGDSRCYRLRGRTLEQVTYDHSVVEEQVRAGELTREQAEMSPIRHVITRAVGVHPEIEVDLYELEARPGDLYLLTTDGLMRELSDDEIAEILGRMPLPVDVAGLERACEMLIRTAVEYGGGDNITCALVYLH